MFRKRFKKIDDYIKEKFIITNVYDEDVEIVINMDTEQNVTLNYKGDFLNILGASFDLINGLIVQFSPELDYTFWEFSIEHFDDFKSSGIYKELICSKPSGKIIFKIDSKTQNIDSEYSSNPLGFIIMIDYFITSFCKEYNIDKKEYLDYYKNAYKMFKDGNYEKLMNIKKVDD